MKAQEYAKRINDAAASGDEGALREAITEAVRGVAGEGAEMFRQRGIKAGAGIVRQMDDKWRAIANRVHGNLLNPNGWRDLITSRLPELAELFERPQAKR